MEIFYNEKSNDNNNFTFAVVSFVSNESRFACTTVGARTVVTNSIYMTTMQAFLTFVDIYGLAYVSLMKFLHRICSA